MSINIFNLEKVIAQKIETATSAEDIAYLTASLKQLKNGQLTVVANFSELPAASTVPTGTLYFVTNDKLVYLSYNAGPDNQWRTIIWDTYNSRLFSWGLNTDGQLGDGTLTNQSSPITCIGGFTDWCQVSAGYRSTAAIRTNGTLWSWGDNSSGQLGNNAATIRSSPVSVVGGFTDWCQVSTNGFSAQSATAAIRTNGTLWMWGLQSAGMGDGTNTSRSSPVSVAGGFTDWCQVSVGNQGHTVAVRQNGTLWAWGQGDIGQLGDGNATSRLSPVSVVGGFTDWCQVSAGRQNSFAIRANGTLWAWGQGGFLGDGTPSNRCSPVSVIGGFTDWCQVSAGNNHVSAIRRNGTLWAWGDNQNGGLGDGTQITRSSPVSVVGGFTNWCQVSTTNSGAAAVRTDGSLWAWGLNSCRRLGDGTTINRSSPVSVFFKQGTWTSVSMGDCHSVAISREIL